MLRQTPKLPEDIDNDPGRKPKQASMPDGDIWRELSRNAITSDAARKFLRLAIREYQAVGDHRSAYECVLDSYQLEDSVFFDISDILTSRYVVENVPEVLKLAKDFQHLMIDIKEVVSKTRSIELLALENSMPMVEQDEEHEPEIPTRTVLTYDHQEGQGYQIDTDQYRSPGQYVD